MKKKFFNSILILVIILSFSTTSFSQQDKIAELKKIVSSEGEAFL